MTSIPAVVEGINHLAEFVPGGVALGVIGVGGLGSTKEDRVITPVIAQLLAGHGIDELTIVFIEFVDGEQLDGGDAQLGELAGFFGEAGVAARIPDTGARDRRYTRGRAARR